MIGAELLADIRVHHKHAGAGRVKCDPAGRHTPTDRVGKLFPLNSGVHPDAQVAALSRLHGLHGRLVIAAEYTIGSYDKGQEVVTLKDKDDKEVTGKLTDKTKVTPHRQGRQTNRRQGGGNREGMGESRRQAQGKESRAPRSRTV